MDFFLRAAYSAFGTMAARAISLEAAAEKGVRGPARAGATRTPYLSQRMKAE